MPEPEQPATTPETPKRKFSPLWGVFGSVVAIMILGIASNYVLSAIYDTAFYRVGVGLFIAAQGFFAAIASKFTVMSAFGSLRQCLSEIKSAAFFVREMFGNFSDIHDYGSREARHKEDWEQPTALSSSGNSSQRAAVIATIGPLGQYRKVHGTWAVAMLFPLLVLAHFLGGAAGLGVLCLALGTASLWSLPSYLASRSPGDSRRILIEAAFGMTLTCLVGSYIDPILEKTYMSVMLYESEQQLGSDIDSLPELTDADKEAFIDMVAKDDPLSAQLLRKNLMTSEQPEEEEDDPDLWQWALLYLLVRHEWSWWPRRRINQAIKERFSGRAVMLIKENASILILCVLSAVILTAIPIVIQTLAWTIL